MSKLPPLHEILSGDPISDGTLEHFRNRFRERLYELVLSEYRKQAEKGMTKSHIAHRINRRPEQITRWLGAPGNWTLETVSDLLLVISQAEPIVGLKFSVPDRGVFFDLKEHGQIFFGLDRTQFRPDR
jgi:hypothetical protein